MASLLTLAAVASGQEVSLMLLLAPSFCAAIRQKQAPGAHQPAAGRSNAAAGAAQGTAGGAAAAAGAAGGRGSSSALCGVGAAPAAAAAGRVGCAGQLSARDRGVHCFQGALVLGLGVAAKGSSSSSVFALLPATSATVLMCLVAFAAAAAAPHSQLGVLAEFRQDWLAAVTSYQASAAALQAVPLGRPTVSVQRHAEVAAVAEVVHFKAMMLLLHQQRYAEALQQLRSHLAAFGPLPGAQAAAAGILQEQQQQQRARPLHVTAAAASDELLLPRPASCRCLVRRRAAAGCRRVALRLAGAAVHGGSRHGCWLAHRRRHAAGVCWR